jgi:hypothetical protein
MVNESDKPVADKETLKRWLASATGLNAVVGVGLFAQKSGDHSSLGTIGLLGVAAAGVYLIFGAAFAHRFRAHRHAHSSAPLLRHWKLAPVIALTGLFLITSSLLALDTAAPGKLPSTSDVPAVVAEGWPRDHSEDSRSVGLRGLQVAHTKSAFRVAIQAINRTSDFQALNRFAFAIDSDGGSSCAGIYYVYELDESISVSSNGTLEGEVRAETGPLEGFNIRVGGSATMGCDDIELRIELPATVILDPKSTATVALDIPSTLDTTVSDVIKSAEGLQEEHSAGDKVQISACFPAPVVFRVEASAATSGEYEIAYSRAYGITGQEAPPGVISPLPC